MGHPDFNRSARIASQLRTEIALLLPEVHGLERLHGFTPTITGVDLSPDMRTAKVYFCTLTGAEKAPQVAEALNHAEGFIRHLLGKRLDVKRIPHFSFVYDKSFDEGQKIDTLLKTEHASHDDSTNG